MTATEAAVDVSQSGPDGYRVTYDRTSVRPSYALVVALSEATAVPLSELGPLQDDVDTDSLDTLLDGGISNVEAAAVSFQFEGYSVTVKGTGTIDLDPVAGNGDGQTAVAQQG